MDQFLEASRLNVDTERLTNLQPLAFGVGRLAHMQLAPPATILILVRQVHNQIQLSCDSM